VIRLFVVLSKIPGLSFLPNQMAVLCAGWAQGGLEDYLV